jgi:hypothetical protein
MTRTTASGRLTAAIFLAAATTITAALVTATQATAGADPAIEIDAVHYNPTGADTHAKLKQEYVTIENDSSHARNLKGWIIRDSAGHTYHFGSRLVPAGSEVRVHTGTGTNSAHDRYWGRGKFVWNNSGDRVTVRNANGTRIDRCTYSGGNHVADCD